MAPSQLGLDGSEDAFDETAMTPLYRNPAKLSTVQSNAGSRPSAFSVTPRGVGSQLTTPRAGASVSGTPSGSTPRASRPSPSSQANWTTRNGSMATPRRKARLNTEHIARPDNELCPLERISSQKKSVVLSSFQPDTEQRRATAQDTEQRTTSQAADQRRATMQEELARKSARLKTYTVETAIMHKEDRLEQIMSAEAYAGFQQMGRYQLNKTYMTRVGINPDLLSTLDLEKLDKQLAEFGRLRPSDDVEHDSDFDDELPAKFGLDAQHWQPGLQAADEHTFATLGLRIGLGFPVHAEPLSDTGEHADRIFVGKCGDYALFGVVNGHGRPSVSGALARFIASQMPQAVFSNVNMSRGGDAAEALTTAFNRVHNMARERFDLRLTGASCSVCLADQEFVWVAHVGDCRAVLGVSDPTPNAEAFHFKPVSLMKDHNLSAKAEFDRVHDYDGEKRRLMNDNVYRLFVRDSDVPGLTLTRSIGHLVGHMVGVMHTPTVSGLSRKDMAEGSFLVLGSGGVWATMSEQVAVNWVSKHYSNAHDAADSLANECHHRWQEPGCASRACVGKQARECFSTLVVYFHEAPPLDTSHEEASERHKLHLPPVQQRAFTLGPHCSSTRPWSEVKSPDRTIAMRRVQAHGRALAEDFSWGAKRELAGTDWAIEQFNTHTHVLRDRS